MSNPFDWTGPEFLKLYALLLAMAVVAAFVVRQGVRRSAASAPALGPYELAYLADGPRRVALVAVTALINRGQATIYNRLIRLTGTDPVPDGLLRRLVATAPPMFSPRAVPRMISGDLELIRQTLQSQDLLVRSEGVWMSRLVTLLTMGGVLATGVAKICVGLSRHRSVEFLMFACLATLVLGVLLMRGLFRTTAGEAMVRQMREERPEPWRPAQQSGGDDTLVALWGMNALQSHASYADLRSTLGPSAASSGYSGSSCSSSSSCSSGSSCGGGGCGGCGSS